MLKKEVPKESNEEEISAEEVHISISRLKSKKALGVCEITGEMIKEGDKVDVR